MVYPARQKGAILIKVHVVFFTAQCIYMYMMYMYSVWSIECRGFESHPRQLIFSRKSDCLGCAALPCLFV